MLFVRWLYRLSPVEKDLYLKNLLGDFDKESDISSDSDDEDWNPVRSEIAAQISDNEEIAEQENGNFLFSIRFILRIVKINN